MAFLGDVVKDLIVHPIQDITSPYRRSARRMDEDANQGENIHFEPETDKFVIFSDFHRGSKYRRIDRFLSNKEVYKNALDYYHQKGYTLVLLGDVEEGWGTGNKIDMIIRQYPEIYEAEEKFLLEGKYYRVFGNHDDLWKKKKKVEKFFPEEQPQDPLKKMKIHSAVILETGGNQILLIHGCQGHNFCDAGDKLAKTAVGVKFKVLKLKSKKKKELKIRDKMRKQEKRVLKWASDKKVLVVMGHTHSIFFESRPIPVFEKAEISRLNAELEKKLPRKRKKQLSKDLDIFKALQQEVEAYPAQAEADPQVPDTYPGVFNSGNCCAGDRLISAIEIAEGEIRLVTWNEKSGGPEVLKDENKEYKRKLAELFDQIN